MSDRAEYQANWKRNRDDRLRKAQGRDKWPCKQCGDTITFKPGRGSQPKVCSSCAPNLRFRMLVSRYGVDKQMFDAMYFEQDGQCAVESCVREAKSVDHDHSTGLVRGLLCQGCNVAVGFLEDQAWSSGANHYLQGHG